MIKEIMDNFYVLVSEKALMMAVVIIAWLVTSMAIICLGILTGVIIWII